MSLSDILNLSQPRLVAAGVVASVVAVGFALHSLQYDPQVWDACENIPIPAANSVQDPVDRAVEQYLEQARNWSQADYCIDKMSVTGNERIVSVRRRGKLVGGGEGFRLRIDPASMTVLGELAHE